MYQEFETFIAHNVEEHNLISKEDLDRIKIKLGKSHRKESDWAVIKDILSSHNVIVVEPAKQIAVYLSKNIFCMRMDFLLFSQILKIAMSI